MDPHALAVLEFDKVRDLLARQAASALGLAAARELAPSDDAAWVRLWLGRTSEARRLLDTGEDLPLGGLHDIGPALAQARRGGVLAPDELRGVAETLRCAANVRRVLRAKDDLPHLQDLALQLVELPHLVDEIERCITEDGEVADAASAELRRLRQLGRTLATRVQTTIRRVLGDLANELAVQENVVTLRSGRYCIPIKATHQGRVQGIVHDRSGSGQTVFVEPAEVVRLNNELREAQAAERAEVERILAALSALIAADGDLVASNLRLLALFDEIRARGRLSVVLRGSEPALSEPGGEIELLAARHPLLVCAEAGREVVPNDLRLGGAYRTLLVTGPNTGGKTVALKTLGLLTLMAHCGLHLPVREGSRVALCADVFADIGDEQSLEQSLSTFGSHLRQIVHIVEAARPGALVLLDEVGAGTDPTEGAALAQAVLSVLHARGCLTMATTHHGTLKAFAYETDGVENASVEFDAQTLAPTYRLLIGIPGASHAFEIAAGLGLSGEVLDLARAILPDEHVEASDLITEMQRTSHRLQRELRDREHEAASAAHQRRELERERRRLRELEVELRAVADREAKDKLAQVQREADQILRELRRAQREGQRTEAARQRLKRLGEQVAARPAGSAVPHEAPAALAPGDRVRVVRLARDGEVLAVEAGGRVTVQVGALRMVVEQADLERLAGPAAKPTGTAGKRAVGGSFSVDAEVHVRGMTVDEALEKVDRFLDQALLGGLDEVRIVHGKGTGTLRKVIWAWLRANPHVAGYQHPPEALGGTGVTVARLG